MLETRKDRIQLLVRRLFLIFYDILAIYLAAILALLIRFELKFSGEMVRYWDVINPYMFIIIPVSLLIFAICHMYSSLWSYAGANEMANIVVACVLSSISQVVIVTYIPPLDKGMPRSYYLLFCVTLFVLEFASRFAYRMIRSISNKRIEAGIKTNVMIVGAGLAGEALIREIANSCYVNKKVV